MPNHDIGAALTEALDELPSDETASAHQQIAESELVAALRSVEEIGRRHGGNSRFWLLLHNAAADLNMPQEAGTYIGIAGAIRRIEELGDEASLWLRDADSHYVGARHMCTSSTYVDPVFIDAFFDLSHGAIERYLKGILSSCDQRRYTSKKLKRKFGHNLVKLLQGVRTHVATDIEHIDWACDVLNREFGHARYLVSAKPSQLVEDAGALSLEDLDRIVCGLRNVLVQRLTPQAVAGSLLVSLCSSEFPFFEQRDAFLRDNRYSGQFQVFRTNNTSC